MLPGQILPGNRWQNSICSMNTGSMKLSEIEYIRHITMSLQCIVKRTCTARQNYLQDKKSYNRIHLAAVKNGPIWYANVYSTAYDEAEYKSVFGLAKDSTHLALMGQLWGVAIIWEKTGPRLNIKTVLSMYGDFHVKDKTAVRTSYL